MGAITEIQLQPEAAAAQTGGFRHSESFAKLAEALRQAQDEFGKAKKDTKNPYYNAAYAPLDTIIDATRPALSKYGLTITQPLSTRGKSVIVTTVMVHVSGEWIATDLELPATGLGKDGKEKFDPQTVGSAFTYGRRYAWQSIVGIAAEEDDDANSTVKQPERKAKFESPVNVPASLQEARRAAPNGFITPAQKATFWKLARTAGKSDEQVKRYLGSEGLEHTEEMPTKDFERHCEWAKGN